MELTVIQKRSVNGFGRFIRGERCGQVAVDRCSEAGVRPRQGPRGGSETRRPKTRRQRPSRQGRFGSRPARGGSAKYSHGMGSPHSGHVRGLWIANGAGRRGAVRGSALTTDAVKGMGGIGETCNFLDSAPVRPASSSSTVIRWRPERTDEVPGSMDRQPQARWERCPVFSLCG